MELFSHRKGLKPVKSKIQVDGMDDELRNGLWSALAQYYWEGVTVFLSYTGNERARFLCRRVWLNYFKVPIDTLPDYWPDGRKLVRD